MGQEKATSDRPVDVTIAMIDAGIGASFAAPAESTVAERFIAIYRAMHAAGAAEFEKLMAEIFCE